MRKSNAVKFNKPTEMETEDVALEELSPASLFDPMPPIQPLPPYGQGEPDEASQEFKVGAVEEGVEPQEPEELEPEPEVEDDYYVYPHDITWEYLKGLEKISLLTPEKEVELAKKIK